jgi:hypothetical protein
MAHIALWGLLMLIPVSILAQTSEPASADSRDSIERRPRQGPHLYKVATYIHHISDINIRDGEYKIELLLYVSSINRAFDSLLIQKLAVRGAKDFCIVNIPLWSRPGSPPRLRDRRLFKINCTMIQSWNVKHYPFGKQQLDIWVYAMVSSQWVLLKDSAKILLPDIGNKTKYYVGNGWHFVKDAATVHTDSIKDAFRPGKYSALHYEIPLREDNPWMLFIKLFLGMYVAFWVAYIALFIPVERQDPRFGLPVGGLFAAIANKYIIEALLPVSTDFNLVDTLHSITITTIFLIIAYSAILVFLVEKKKLHELNSRNEVYSIFPDIRMLSIDPKKLNFVIITLLTLYYVCLNLYFIWVNFKAAKPSPLEVEMSF